MGPGHCLQRVLRGCWQTAGWRECTVRGWMTAHPGQALEGISRVLRGRARRGGSGMKAGMGMGMRLERGV